MIVYASTDEKVSFDEAVALIKARGYTKAQVRMLRKNGSLVLEELSDL